MFNEIQVPIDSILFFVQIDEASESGGTAIDDINDEGSEINDENEEDEEDEEIEEDEEDEEFQKVDEDISFKPQGDERINTLDHLLDTMTNEQGDLPV